MNPILGGLANEVLLSTARGGVALDGVATGTDKVIQPGQLDNERVVVVLPERFSAQPCSKDGSQVPLRLFLQ